eukprot:8213552-Heterocapsa_arctica.AAC.1
MGAMAFREAMEIARAQSAALAKRASRGSWPGFVAKIFRMGMVPSEAMAVSSFVPEIRQFRPAPR